MKLIYIILLFSLTDSLFSQLPEENNPTTHPHGQNKFFIDSLKGKSINFYLQHKNIDNYSKLFYEGKWAITDDDLTASFLDSILTTNNQTRIFYLYIFNSAMSISDGSIAEFMAYKCLDYFKKYPCEFIEMKHSRLFSDNFQKWIDNISWMYESHDIHNIKKELLEIQSLVELNCSQNINDFDEVRELLISTFNEK